MPTYTDLRSIGGSDVAAILGLSRYKTGAQVYDRIMGLSDNDDRSDAPQLRRGSTLEPIIAEEYINLTGARLEEWEDPVTHPQHTFLHARPDRVFAGVANQPFGIPGELGILEIKCLGKWTFEQTERDGVHPEYHAQLQHYMFVTGAQWGAFAIFNADKWDFIDPWSMIVTPDPAWQEENVPKILRWWEQYIETGTRPPMTQDDRPAYTPAQVGTEEDWADNREWNEACAALKAAEDQAKLAEHAKKLAQERVKAMMGDVEVVRGVHGKVTFKEQTRTTFDKRSFVRDNPNIDISDWERTSTSRTFRTYLE
jgi:putative phage-type endonuclease